MFKGRLEKYSKEAFKEQCLIACFSAAHPGTTDLDRVNLALWLKKHNSRGDQVQAFYPSPMVIATAMYHPSTNLLHKVTYDSEKVEIVRSRG